MNNCPVCQKMIPETQHCCSYSCSSKDRWADPEFRAKAVERNRINGRKAADITRGKRKSEETIVRMKEAARIRRQNPEYVAFCLHNLNTQKSYANRSKSIASKWKNDLNYREKVITASRKADDKRRLTCLLHYSGEAGLLLRQKRSMLSRQLQGTPEYRAKMGAMIKALWQSPEFVAKQMKARGVKPNKSEMWFQSVLDTNFPNEWKYVGDGQLIIGGKCPDFANINGKKTLIELFGSYWHKGENSQVKIDHYTKYGYKCLVIWDTELTNLDTALDRIRKIDDTSGPDHICSSEPLEMKRLVEFARKAEQILWNSRR